MRILIALAIVLCGVTAWGQAGSYEFIPPPETIVAPGGSAYTGHCKFDYDLNAGWELFLVRVSASIDEDDGSFTVGQNWTDYLGEPLWFETEYVCTASLLDPNTSFPPPGGQTGRNFVYIDARVTVQGQVPPGTYASLPDSGVIEGARFIINCDASVPVGTQIVIEWDPGGFTGVTLPCAGGVVGTVMNAWNGILGTLLTYVPGDTTSTVLVQAGFRRGFLNGDSVLDITDLNVLIDALFGQNPLVCEDAGDCNDDGFLNIADIAYLASYLFSGGAAPLPPHATCGVDPFVVPADALRCNTTQAPCP